MERAFDADFRKEDDRYRAATASPRCSKPWFEARTLDEVRKALDEHGVCWGPYQTFTQLLDDDWRASPVNPVFGERRPPGHRRAAHAGVADAVPDRRRRCRPRRRRCSACTPTRCSTDVLGLSPAEIGRLHDDGVVAQRRVVTSR